MARDRRTAFLPRAAVPVVQELARAEALESAR